MNFPKFMIRQTGGTAVGAISTRSRVASFAFWSASAIGTTPRGSPASPIKRTSFHRICSLTRMLFLSIFHLRDRTQLVPFLRNGVLRDPGKLVERHRSRISPVAEAHGDRSSSRFLLAHYQHAGDLLHLRLSDACAELFVAVVGFHPKTSRLEILHHLARPVRELFRDRQHDRLHRRNPEWEVAGGVLDQDPEKPLHGSQDRAVQQNGAVRLPVLPDVRQVEAFGLHEIALDCAAPPGPADRGLYPVV